MAHTVLAISLSSTVHSYPFSPIQLYYNPYRREQASLKLLLGPTSQTNLTGAFHRGVKGDFSNHKWFLNNQIRLKWCYETLHNLQMRIICKSGRTQAEIYSEMDFFFFHSLHRLKKLMYFSFSHHVPIFTSNWESRAPTDQWSPCRAYVNTKSLEELWQLSWNYILEIHSVENSNHLYSYFESSGG